MFNFYIFLYMVMLLMIHGSCFIHLYFFFRTVRFSSQTETFYVFIYVVNVLGTLFSLMRSLLEFLLPTKLSSFSLAVSTIHAPIPKSPSHSHNLFYKFQSNFLLPSSFLWQLLFFLSLSEQRQSSVAWHCVANSWDVAIS